MRLQACNQWLGETTNNVAEYRALIEGLKLVKEWKPDRLIVFLDSKLVVEQINGGYKVRKQELIPLHRQATELLAQFADYEVEHVEREKNRGADYLANKAIDAHVPKSKFGG
jgi:ribonuclease HI